MTQGIEDMLNLPSMEEVFGKTKEPVQDSEEIAVEDEGLQNAVAVFEEAEKVIALKDAKGGDGHAQSMDAIHDEMLEAAQTLMKMGHNVDQRSAATIFEKAVMLYKGALDAKNSKRDMQLKALKLILDQKKLELEEKKVKAELGEKEIDSEYTILEDRNELIRKIRESRASAPSEE